MLYIAGALTVLIGCAHSYLGEKYILRRLVREDNLPPLFGGEVSAPKILRFAWHLTTIAWWGFAVLLFMLVRTPLSPALVGQVIAIVFGIHSLITLAASRGRHPAWIVFLLIAILSWMASC
ncbi:hypothetical protein N9Z12_04295 [Opitutaceae bacterium]|nr:hypothetical protein [Opitutaceae bacterium]